MMTFSIMEECCLLSAISGSCHLCLLSFMLDVTNYPFMLSAVVLSVVILSVLAPIAKNLLYSKQICHTEKSFQRQIATLIFHPRMVSAQKTTGASTINFLLT
jgi:hypothetical protein